MTRVVELELFYVTPLPPPLGCHRLVEPNQTRRSVLREPYSCSHHIRMSGPFWIGPQIRLHSEYPCRPGHSTSISQLTRTETRTERKKEHVTWLSCSLANRSVEEYTKRLGGTRVLLCSASDDRVYGTVVYRCVTHRYLHPAAQLAILKRQGTCRYRSFHTSEDRL